MLNFKIIPLDNISFNFQELTDYYLSLKTNYQHLKWVPPAKLEFKLYTWSIQTNLEDINIPATPYEIPNEWKEDSYPKISNHKFNTPTSLIFGFAEKILKVFPKAKQFCCSTHGPNFVISPHIDKEYLDEDHVKIHIPIESNDQSYFEFDNEKFVMSAGKFYLVNTMLMHNTINLGQTERAHLIFKIPVVDVDTIINTKISI